MAKQEHSQLTKALSSTIAPSDFGRVLRLLAVDPAFEREVLEQPGSVLREFRLDADEREVLQQYRRWRVIR